MIGSPTPEMEDGSVSKSVAVIACTAMSFFYVAILYSPTLILRLPPPTSLNNFMIRRFICALVSSILSIFISALILPIRSWEASSLFGVYGIRVDHLWHALVFPISVTSLLYAGSLVSKSLLLVNSWKEQKDHGRGYPFDGIKIVSQRFLDWITSIASSVLAWRNYVVAPLTEELVFRACMIPLLLCGGFKTYNAIFLSSIFFSLAHLNHFLELYSQQNYSFLKASMVVGLQLGYTVIFGSYASFLFIRSGHLLAPIVAHAFCNIMGLPVLSSRRKGVSLTAVRGDLTMVRLWLRLESPYFYTRARKICICWGGMSAKPVFTRIVFT
ncbi:hypothetical protein HHK36_011369 [Tetracentron sinense]|uniref:intramembrane prenyl-peptidase Rce1 n=1 Tax=Tetracentron sinense TaxID=13715 RepID=A0A834ZDE8_TETSI|nr:hypothetical protein HHK36_011369 [Tetracentron sinense]